QVDGVVAQLRALQRAMGPTTATLARQREAVGLLERQAQITAAMGTDSKVQADAMLAGRRESLLLPRDELETQRRMRSIVPSMRRVCSDLMWGGACIVGGLAYATQQATNFNQTALEADVALGGYTRSPAQRQSDILALQRAAMTGSEATGFFS